MREIDVLDKLKAFDDTMTQVNTLKNYGHLNESKHMHMLWKVAKELGTEVRQLRKELKDKKHGSV